MHMFRTHTCGALRSSDVGSKVKLSGWIHSVRDHGGVIFIDLRDHYGKTQVVIDPKMHFYQELDRWRVETVVCFTGTVVARTPETVNPKLVTGEIEVVAEEMEVLGEADVIPFQIAKDEQAPEALRLKYRFLDLRREKLHENILLRSKVISEIRRFMCDMGFMEYQTPILTSSSPEGARDYLVPSRVHPGKFYALPQAPQQFKQLLMVAGFDRYFQIAPCFRDEDARADRSPGEFYQLDVEMSFVTQDDIFAVIEKLLCHIFKKFSRKEMGDAPFVRIPYREAMSKYGTDKPDLRNPLQMMDVSSVFADSGFNAFASTVKNGGVVRAIKVPGIGGAQPRKFYDDMIAFAQSVGAKGMAYINMSLFGNSTFRQIVTKTEYFSENTVLSAWDGYEALAGARLNTFENSDVPAWRTGLDLFGMGMVLKRKLTISASASAAYSFTPQYIGQALTGINDASAGGMVNLRFVPSRKWSVSANWICNYVNSTDKAGTLLSERIIQNASANGSVNFAKYGKFNINYRICWYDYLRGIGTDFFSQSLNASISWSFLKRSLTLSLQGIDLLNSGHTYTSTVTAQSSVQTWQPVYGRYFMLSLKYVFRRK